MVNSNWSEIVQTKRSLSTAAINILIKLMTRFGNADVIQFLTTARTSRVTRLHNFANREALHTSELVRIIRNRTVWQDASSIYLKCQKDTFKMSEVRSFFLKNCSVTFHLTFDSASKHNEQQIISELFFGEKCEGCFEGTYTSFGTKKNCSERHQIKDLSS